MHAIARIVLRIALLVVILRLAAGPARAQCWDWSVGIVGGGGEDPPHTSRLVYDGARHAVWSVFGGYASGGSPNVAVWRVLEEGWLPVATGVSPPGPRHLFAVCYDEARQRVLFYGGRIGTGASATPMNDLWEWDGSTWSQIPQSGPWPFVSHAALMAYDTRRDRAILLRYTADGVWGTWEWTGSAWEQGPATGPIGLPGDVGQVAFCFDASQGYGFLYTKDDASPNAEIYYYVPGATAAQSEWLHVPGFGPPSPAYEGVTLVYDPHRRNVLRHGGRLGAGGPSDANTYIWNPVTMAWSAPFAATNNGFHGGRGCFDADTDRVVIAGGFVGTSSPQNITWRLTTETPGLSVDLPPSAAWCAGSNHALAVTKVGAAASNVQWFKDGNALAGATATILVVNSAGPQHAGLYECRVSNGCGEIWSRQCAVTVSTPVSIQQPFFYYGNVCPGGTMAFVHPLPPAGSSATLVLQKRFGEFWQTVPVPYNEFEQAFIVPDPQNADTGWYRLAIGSGCGTVVSDPVHVQVGVTFDSQPQSLSLAACQGAQFSVDAAGVGALTYLWHRNGQAVADGDHVSGATTDTLTIAGARYDDEGLYHCLVSDTCEARQTAGATLTIPAPPPWVHRTTSGPAYRSVYQSDIAYDPVRGVTVLYGGYGTAGYLDDTWEWDGVEWTRRFPPHNPGRRSGQELVFDPGRGAILLFGGSGVVPPNSEVWAYDGTDWSLITTSPNGPPVNEWSHGDAAFDAARGKLVLVCEGPFSLPPRNVTWEFDSAAATWQIVSESVGPSHASSPISFDAALSATVGQHYHPGQAPTEARTWTQSGGVWNNLGVSTPVRYWPAMAYDAFRARTTLFGCCRNSGPGAYTTDTHALQGAQWGLTLPDIHTTQGDAPVPVGMAFDTKRRAMVMLASTYDDYWLGLPLQTWEYRYLDKVVIDRQPVDQDLIAGQNAAFTVHAAGTGVLSYQWLKGGTPVVNGPTGNGSIVSGATTATLSIAGVTAGDAGAYACAVSNSCGQAMTEPAHLGTVCYPDCNGSGTVTVADFGCFQTKFILGDMYADCNQSGTLTVQDFGCFQLSYIAGCP